MTSISPSWSSSNWPIKAEISSGKMKSTRPISRRAPSPGSLISDSTTGPGRALDRRSARKVLESGHSSRAGSFGDQLLAGHRQIGKTHRLTHRPPPSDWWFPPPRPPAVTSVAADALRSRHRQPEHERIHSFTSPDFIFRGTAQFSVPRAFAQAAPVAERFDRDPGHPFQVLVAHKTHYCPPFEFQFPWISRLNFQFVIGDFGRQLFRTKRRYIIDS